MGESALNKQFPVTIASSDGSIGRKRSLPALCLQRVEEAI